MGGSGAPPENPITYVDKVCKTAIFIIIGSNTENNISRVIFLR